MVRHGRSQDGDIENLEDYGGGEGETAVLTEEPPASSAKPRRKKAAEPDEAELEEVRELPIVHSRKAYKTPTGVDPRELRVDPARNVSRYKPEAHEMKFITQLAESMSRLGNVQSVLVRSEGGYDWLMAGFKRHRAALLLREGFDWTDPDSGEIRHIHVPDFKLQVRRIQCSAKEAAELCMEENAIRRGLSAMDYATACAYSRNVLGHSAAQTARILAIGDSSYVSQYEKLLVLPDDIRDQIHKSAIPIRVAMMLPDLDPETREKRLKGHIEWRESNHKAGSRMTQATVGEDLREQKARTGRGKTVSMTTGQSRKHMVTIAQAPATQQPVKALCATFYHWTRGDKSFEVWKKVLNTMVGDPIELGMQLRDAGVEQKDGVLVDRAVWESFVKAIGAAEKICNRPLGDLSGKKKKKGVKGEEAED